MEKIPVHMDTPAVPTAPRAPVTTGGDGLESRLFGSHPAYTRLARHLTLLRRYGRPSKLLNIARNEIARLRGDIEVSAFP
ncbi:MAG: nucleotide-binding universal stress UspA family protein, partial [Gammaproteobacteria bacterium]